MAAIFGIRLSRGLITPAVLLSAISLALGIGPNLAVYSVLQASALHALPYPDDSRLVVVQDQYTGGLRPAYSSEVARWAGQADLFENLGSFWPLQQVIPLQTRIGADPIRVSRTSPGALRSLGVGPEIGSLFTDAQQRSVLLSDHIWRRDFAADPRILGESIALQGKSYTVVGVMPAAFEFPHTVETRLSSPDVWVPLVVTPAEALSNNYLGIARLRKGVTPDRASALLTARMPPVGRADGPRAILVRPLRAFALGQTANRLGLFAAATLILLLLACCNTAGIALMRREAKRRNQAIRLALGAPRRRIIRAECVEIMLIAGGAAAMGIGLGQLLLRFVVSHLPHGFPHFGAFFMDWSDLGLACATGLIAAAAAGLLPLFSASSGAPSRLLAGMAPTASSSAKRVRLLRSVVVGEVAMALALATGAALVARAFDRVSEVQPGFVASGVFAGSLQLPRSSKKEAQRFAMGLIDPSSGYPGLLALSTGVPGIHADETEYSTDAGVPPNPNGPFAYYQGVLGEYFSVMKVPFLAGRAFSKEEAAGSVPACIIDRRMAEALAGTTGRRAGIGNLAASLGRLVVLPEIGQLRVVGVVDNIHLYGGDMALSQDPEIYFPLSLSPAPQVTVLTRTNLTVSEASLKINSILAVAGSSPRAVKLTSLSDNLESLIEVPRFNFLLLLSFGLIGGLIACAGVYATMGYWTLLRADEMAIRATLGASPRQLLQHVGIDCARTIVPGVLIGALIALTEASTLASLFSGVRSNDLLAYVVGAGVVISSAALAGGVACVRTLRVEPGQELRRAGGGC